MISYKKKIWTQKISLKGKKKKQESPGERNSSEKIFEKKISWERKVSVTHRNEPQLLFGFFSFKWKTYLISLNFLGFWTHFCSALQIHTSLPVPRQVVAVMTHLCVTNFHKKKKLAALLCSYWTKYSTIGSVIPGRMTFILLLTFQVSGANLLNRTTSRDKVFILRPLAFSSCWRDCGVLASDCSRGSARNSQNPDLTSIF